MNQKSVRISNALTALSALAAAVVVVVVISGSGILSAQGTTTTTIDLLNVGMCVTTDDSVFKEKDCDDGDGNETFTVGDRDELVERETVYATYAFDPISATVRPRAILENADLVKVTITDKGRDRRRSVLYPAAITSNTSYATLLTGNAGAPVVAKIKELIKADSGYAEMLSDEDNISGFQSQQITLYQPRKATGDAVITDSGPAGLNFKRTGSEDFLPISDDKDNDVVLFFGFEVNEALTPGAGPELTDVDDVAGVQTNVADLKILGAGDDQELIADEDRSSGGGDTPPWLSVLANVPNGKDLVVVAVLYETSDSEVIEGNEKCSVALTVTPATGTPTTNNDKCAPNAEQGETEPNYTKSEIDSRQSLVARVQGDNNKVAQHLYLQEDGKFSGRYTGYIRVTDADGDGRDTGSTPANWGRNFVDGTAATVTGATVIGASSGPVVITYKDSKGSTREMSIEIDIQPPTITIATPRHDTSGDDRSPDFIGTFQDGGAGLADDTFALYVDNQADVKDSKVGDSVPDRDPVLNIPFAEIGIAGSKTRVERPADYASTDSFATPFGILSGRASAGSGAIYFTTTGDEPEAHATDNDAERKIVSAESYEDGDGQGTFDDDARVEGTTSGREIAVDFQGVVIDLAGNIGFSDANTGKPTRINDLGTEAADRAKPLDHNVLGWFSRHVINLDDKDPVILKDHTVTGFYGLDSDDDLVPHRRGIMITFDNDVSPDNITASTFEVELDDKSKAAVDDVMVEDNLVFLRLVNDLGASETPKITIASGQRVEDFAGNQLLAREVKEAIEAKDGVPPTLTVSLSGGSGAGELSSSLTRNTIVVSVSSDERLQGAPLVSVVCSNFEYTDTESGSTVRMDVDDFAEARSGALTATPMTTGLGTPKCGKGNDARDFTPEQTQITQVSGSDRVWVYTWANPGGDNGLPEGLLRVVAFGRDRSQYKIKPGAINTHNWGSETTSFSYDTVLKPLVMRSEVDSSAGSVLPEPSHPRYPSRGKVSEDRPFIILHFTGESTDVTIEKLQVNDVDVTSRLDIGDGNRFIYWPEGLNFGTHKVEVDARDAAGNETTFRYEFEKVTRSPFVLKLLAGWNAVSLPQHPVDGSLESVFKDPKITQVISYVRTSDDEPAGKWNVATRLDGIWTTSIGDLTSVEAGPGYWVNADNFVNQSIALRSAERLSRDLPVEPVGLDVYDGWNFVGVVDQTGRQTQNDFGQTLKNAQDVAQTGRMYLGNYVRAYTWNATLIQFEELEKTNLGVIMIGDGIWVYYGEGLAP